MCSFFRALAHEQNLLSAHGPCTIIHLRATLRTRLTAPGVRHWLLEGDSYGFPVIMHSPCTIIRLCATLRTRLTAPGVHHWLLEGGSHGSPVIVPSISLSAAVFYIRLGSLRFFLATAVFIRAPLINAILFLLVASRGRQWGGAAGTPRYMRV